MFIPYLNLAKTKEEEEETMDKRGCVALLLGLLIALVWGLWAIAPAHAEYVPSDQFIAHMSEQATFFQEFGVKVVHAGKPYQKGDTAYFITAGEGTWLLFLERWKETSPLSFRVITYRLGEREAFKGVRIYKNLELIPDDPDARKEKAIGLDSDEARTASEIAQKVLLQHAGAQEL